MVEIYSRPLVSQFREREYQKSPSPNLKIVKIDLKVNTGKKVKSKPEKLS